MGLLSARQRDRLLIIPGYGENECGVMRGQAKQHEKAVIEPTISTLKTPPDRAGGIFVR